MKIHINKLDLALVLLWMAIFPFHVLSTEVYYVFRVIVVLIIMLISIGELKRIPSKFWLFSYPIAIIISCIVNRSSILFANIVKGAIYALIIISMFFLLQRYIKIRGTEKLYKIFYQMSKIYFLINIVWILFFVITGNINEAVKNENFFSGGKFSVSYLLLIYLMFFCVSWSGNKIFTKKSKKTIFIVLSLICIVTCSLIQSATGVVAISLFLLIMLVSPKILKLINNPIVLVGLIVGSTVLVFSLNVILASDLVQELVVNVLGKDLSLTGRMQLYELLYPLLFESGLWGGGFGSYVANQLGYHGWYNAQNGLAEIILTYGFVGGGTFLAMAFATSALSKNYIEPLNATILVFIIISIIEIPFNLGFILLLALLMCSNSKMVENGAKLPQLVSISLKKG